MTQKREGKLGLLGYSVETMEAAEALGYEFVAVVPPGFEEHLHKDGIEAVPWQFDKISSSSQDLRAQLEERGCHVVVPLYEECVEWAGAINAQLLEQPRLFNRALLLRDKAMMKRKAQIMGIRVGAFEEVDSRAHLKRFFKRVNQALAKLDDEEHDLVHVKPLMAAGSVGHRVIRTEADADEIDEDAFPMLAESHLGGQEFSCEAFIHEGKVAFMNINEYLHLGYTQMTPCGPELEAQRDKIRKAVKKLVRSFEIEYGVIHPEYFIDAEGELAFGEVANRVPGGQIFELIKQAYGFDPYQALLLSSDPKVSHEELAEFFPDEVSGRKGYAGNVLVFPKAGMIKSLHVPDELLQHPCYDRHNLYEPMEHKVVERTGFGNHYGTIFFFGDDPGQVRDVVNEYEKVDFYVS